MFGQKTPVRSALEEIKEREAEEGGLAFYSFNPRMIPDDVISKPVLRKLQPRQRNELILSKSAIKLAKKENNMKIKPRKQAANKRKSRSLNHSPVKKTPIAVQNETLSEKEPVSDVDVESVGKFGMMSDNQSESSESQVNGALIDALN